MSAKKKLLAFAIVFGASTVALVMALPWATPAMVFDALGLLTEYPPLLILLGGIAAAALLVD